MDFREKFWTELVMEKGLWIHRIQAAFCSRFRYPHYFERSESENRPTFHQTAPQSFQRQETLSLFFFHDLQLQQQTLREP